MEQKIKIIAGLLFGITGLLSCENDVGPLILDAPSGPVSFNRDIQPIFDAGCIGCHDDSHQQLDLRNCCSYQELWSSGAGAPYVLPDNPAQSKLYRHLTGDLPLMPPFGSLPEYEVNLVLKWITEGAEDN